MRFQTGAFCSTSSSFLLVNRFTESMVHSFFIVSFSPKTDRIKALISYNFTYSVMLLDLNEKVVHEQLPALPAQRLFGCPINVCWFPLINDVIFFNGSYMIFQENYFWLVNSETIADDNNKPRERRQSEQQHDDEGGHKNDAHTPQLQVLNAKRIGFILESDIVAAAFYHQAQDLCALVVIGENHKRMVDDYAIRYFDCGTLIERFFGDRLPRRLHGFIGEVLACDFLHERFSCAVKMVDSKVKV